jgi:pantoate--beta-alanine ligase
VEVARTRAALGGALRRIQSVERVAFVPTMGAFHAGHLSLMRAAHAAHDVVVVSIFLNPLQFGPGEDLASYPRDEARDLELAAAEGIDVVFAPPVEEVYPAGHSTRVTVGDLARILEGASRPGHFDGVCTVVAKLLNLVAPDAAYFGQKDAQQVAVLRRMVEDLGFDVRIEVCDTVRDHDGLALSSRNAYLEGDERERAATLYRALREGRAVLDAGGDPAAAEEAMRQRMSSVDGVSLDYAAAVDPVGFGAPPADGPVLLLIAGRVGRTRLIDNLLWTRSCSS